MVGIKISHNKESYLVISALRVGFEQALCIVCGPIIDDDCFERWKPLIEHRMQSFSIYELDYRLRITVTRGSINAHLIFLSK